MSKKKKYKKVKKADYSDKTLKNPFLKEKKRGRGARKRSFSIRKIMLFIIIIIIIVSGLWFFYFSETFKINNIEVNGEFRADEEEIKTLIKERLEGNKFIFPKNNLFIYDKDSLSNDLQNKYNFAKLEVSKIIPDTLSVSVFDRVYSAIWFEEGSYYYIDNEGFILDKINSLEEISIDDYPIIDNQSSRLITDKVVNKKINSINFILKTWNSFKKKESNLTLEKFIIKNEKNSLNLQLLNGPILYLNLLEDPEKQIDNLIILHQKEIKDSMGNLNYIDLRYNETIYYK